jgi:flavin reductase (DIM6/NTAB) family NADH-FMN oxidoreductase RutF/pimeloyl-ACP methyl ester carboxylesterase
MKGKRVAQASFEGDRGIRIDAEVFGDPDDPAVLLLPATTQTKEMWHGAGAALGAAGRYAVCVDLRGHGGSGFAVDGAYGLDAYAADICAIVGQLPSRPTIVGIGASGLAALLAVGERPSPIASALILVGVTPWAEQALATRVATAIAVRAEVFADAQAALSAITNVHPFEPSPKQYDKLLAAFEVGPDGSYRWRGDHRVLGAINLRKEARRLEAAATKIALPTLLVRGTLNESVSADATRRLQEAIVGSESVEIDGVGHHVVTDREDSFNAALLDFLERKAPRVPLQYTGGSDPRALRDALGCFGTGVTVVTTVDEGGKPIGLTANSFTSVSLDPPLILFSLSRASASLGAFTRAKGFVVNVLHIGQQPTSNRFARRDASRFEGVAWAVGDESGAPMITGSLASFDCVQHAVHEAGDHVIFIGEVKRALFEPRRDPLLYFRGKYRRLHFT